jgi:hypothetical protein
MRTNPPLIADLRPLKTNGANRSIPFAPANTVVELDRSMADVRQPRRRGL